MDALEFEADNVPQADPHTADAPGASAEGPTLAGGPVGGSACGMVPGAGEPSPLPRLTRVVTAVSSQQPRSRSGHVSLELAARLPFPGAVRSSPRWSAGEAGDLAC